jgi:hypothetical protein
MLQGKLVLHDCTDTEALCQAIIAKAGLDLRPHQRDDLLAFLIATAWELSLRYEAGRGSTTSFTGWATTNLRLRITDWFRQEYGRTRYSFSDRKYERPQPQLLSLDDDQLAIPQPTIHLDSERDSDADLLRILAPRDRPALRSHGRNGRHVDDKAAA